MNLVHVMRVDVFLEQTIREITRINTNQSAEVYEAVRRIICGAA